MFWDLFGEQGHPIRTTITEMGPLLLSRLLGLNDTQEGVLNAAFRMADDQGLLLLDMKDLRAILAFVADNAGEVRSLYGNVSSASVGAIQRSLLVLEEQGGEQFFGEPALNISEFMRTTPDGRDTSAFRRGQAHAKPVSTPPPSVAVVGAVRRPARGWRPGPPAPGFLLR